MKITALLTDGSKVVGFAFSNGGYTEYHELNELYSRSFIGNVLASGYSYGSLDYRSITDVNGVSISNLPAEAVTPDIQVELDACFADTSDIITTEAELFATISANGGSVSRIPNAANAAPTASAASALSAPAPVTDTLSGMQITNVIKQNGETVGFLVNDSGDEYGIPPKGVFMKVIMDALLQAGYKYYDYAVESVETPKGVAITSLPEVELSSLDEIIEITLSDYSVMDESNYYDRTEASKFFTFRASTVPSFREPVEIKIKTREELVEYLKSLSKASRRSEKIDRRPLNAYVAKEALFTVSELEANTELRKAFGNIEYLLNFQNFKEYQKVVDFLVAEGALQKSNPTPIEFITAYHSWGPIGIKDICTSTTVEMGVQRSELWLNANDAPVDLAYENATLLLDGENNLRYLDQCINISNLTSLRGEILTHSLDEGSTTKLLRTSLEGKKYLYTNGFHKISDNWYTIDIVDENGYNYTYRFSSKGARVFNTRKPVAFFRGFVYSGFYNMKIPFNQIRTSDDIYLWNLAIIKAYNIIQDKTVTPPHESFFDMLMHEGISPMGALEYMATCTFTDTDVAYNETFIDWQEKKVTLSDVVAAYCGEIPEEVMTYFNYSYNDEISHHDNITALIAKAESFIEENQLVAPSSKSSEEERNQYNQAAEVRTINMQYIYEVKFVQDVLINGLSVSNTAEGLISDSKYSILSCLYAIMTIVMAERSKGADPLAVLNDVDNNIYINMNDPILFPVRNFTYTGMLEDRNRFRFRRAEKAWAWCWCNRVYRELSNTAASEARHYLMEMVVITDENLRSTLTEIVRDSAPKYLTETEARDYELNAPEIAAKLLFGLFLDAYDEGSGWDEEDDYYFNYKMGDFCYKIPGRVYNYIKQIDPSDYIMYITLCDYCDKEVNTASGYFNFYTINADVTPWAVTPKPGCTIPEYGLLPNWFSEENYRAWSDSWNPRYVDDLYAEGQKVTTLSNLNPSEDFILYNEAYELLREPLTEETKNIYLYDIDVEPVNTYIERYLMDRNLTAAEGKCLKRVPMRSDVKFARIAELFGYETHPEVECYPDGTDVDSNGYAYWQADVDILQADTSKFNATRALPCTRIVPFDPKKYSYQTAINWKSLIVGDSAPTGNVFVQHQVVVIPNGSNPDIYLAKNITRDIADSLVSRGLFYTLCDGTYLIQALNGNYVLEVI